MVSLCYLVAVLVASCAIGLGPARLLVGHVGSVSALALAPTIGWCLTAIVSSLLVSLGVPVGVWALPWLVIASACSLFVCSRLPSAPRQGAAPTAGLALGASATFALLVAPQLAGGAMFTVFRGNGTDSLNYVAMADALDWRPLGTWSGTPEWTLFREHPLGPLQQSLLRDRWVTAALMAFTARLVGQRPVEVEFAFSAAGPLLCFGAWFSLLLRARRGPWIAAAGATAICAGGLTPFVIDLRAQSHLSALPSCTLIASALSMPAGPRSRALSLAIGLASTGLLYAEIVPFMALGVALSVLLAWRAAPAVGRAELRSLAQAAVLSLLLGASQLPRLTVFLGHQLVNATQPTHNSWSPYFFDRWLYLRPWCGLWGLSHAPARLAPSWPWSSTLCTVLSLVLTGIVAAYLLHTLRRSRGALRRSVVALLTAGLLQTGVLLLGKHWWSAGKAMTFVAPTLGCALVLACTRPARAPEDRGVRLASVALGAWLLLLLGQAIDRVHLARVGQDPPDFIYHFGSYRRDDPYLHRIVSALAGREVAVCVFVPNSAQAEYVMSSLPRGVRVVAGPGVRRAPPGWLEAMRGANADYLIARRDGVDASWARLAEADTSELVLIPARPEGPHACWFLATAESNSPSAKGTVEVHVIASEAGTWLLDRWSRPGELLSTQVELLPGPQTLVLQDERPADTLSVRLRWLAPR